MQTGSSRGEVSCEVHSSWQDSYLWHVTFDLYIVSNAGFLLSFYIKWSMLVNVILYLFLSETEWSIAYNAVQAIIYILYIKYCVF